MDDGRRRSSPKRLRNGMVRRSNNKHRPGSAGVRRALTALRRCGILLESDQRLPSVSMLIAKTPFPGSWWAHPEAHTIYSAIRRLRSHPDLVTTRLVSGKITYIHRRLFGALLAVATSHEAWQLHGLSPQAKALLKMVSSKGVVQSNLLRRGLGQTGKSAGQASRELEKRLLVHSTEIHTHEGFHAKRLETWSTWARRVGSGGSKVAPAVGKRRLESAVHELSRRLNTRIRLPWYWPWRSSARRKLPSIARNAAGGK